MREIDDVLDIKIALSQLMPLERDVILLYFFENREEREIAAIFSTSQQRINFVKQRGLKKLKKFFIN